MEWRDGASEEEDGPWRHLVNDFMTMAILMVVVYLDKEARTNT